MPRRPGRDRTLDETFVNVDGFVLAGEDVLDAAVIVPQPQKRHHPPRHLQG